LTAASCPKKDFYTPPTQKNVQQTFVMHTQNSESFVLRTQKSAPKAGPKVGKKGSKKCGKKVAKNAARKVAKKFVPEPVLLLS